MSNSPRVTAEPTHSPGLRRRVAMTVGCRDCDDIPKVSDAGELVDTPDGRVQVMHNGVRVAENSYYGPWATEIIRQLRGHHEPQEEKAFHALLDHVASGGTMIEFGSYWSYYSLWFHKAVPGAVNYMVEPDPNNLEVGRRNFALNGYEGHFLHAAVGKESRPPAPFRCESDQKERMVPTVGVDDLIAAHRLGRVDVLLADVQGPETQLLEGATKSLDAGVIRFLVLSTHHHSISRDPLTHQKCLKALTGRGANILCAHSVSESYSGDGLIVAAVRPEDRTLAPIPISRNAAVDSLFRELEYDLADAYVVINGLRQELRRVAAHLDQLGRGQPPNP